MHSKCTEFPSVGGGGCPILTLTYCILLTAPLTKETSRWQGLYRTGPSLFYLTAKLLSDSVDEQYSNAKTFLTPLLWANAGPCSLNYSSSASQPRLNGVPRRRSMYVCLWFRLMDCLLPLSDRCSLQAGRALDRQEQADILQVAFFTVNIIFKFYFHEYSLGMLYNIHWGPIRLSSYFHRCCWEKSPPWMESQDSNTGLAFLTGLYW